MIEASPKTMSKLTRGFKLTWVGLATTIAISVSSEAESAPVLLSCQMDRAGSIDPKPTMEIDLDKNLVVYRRQNSGQQFEHSFSVTAKKNLGHDQIIAINDFMLFTMTMHDGRFAIATTGLRRLPNDGFAANIDVESGVCSRALFD